MKRLSSMLAILFAATTACAQVSVPQRPAQSAQPQAASPAKGSAAKIDPVKEADIRSLVELTGAKEMSTQLLQGSLAQFRASLEHSLPPGEKSKKFADAFMQKFQERFSLDVLMNRVVPIYDKYLTAEDVKGLLKFYGSPLGQRMLKVQPQIGKEAQAIGLEMAQTVGREVLNDLRAEYPEFVPAEKP